MGAKGKIRREKNFRKAHGGAHRLLPPPPNPSSIDAIPAKLRQLISLTASLSSSSSPSGSNKSAAVDKKQNKKEGNNAIDSKLAEKDDIHFKSTGIEEDGHLDQVEFDDGLNAENVNSHEKTKKKRKRKRKEINDLRFEEAKEVLGIGSKRKERKKKHLQEMKKKKKNPKTDQNTEFPARDIIKFGDVVQAPPKLPALSKGLKVKHDASKERLRLKAIDDYRKRKGWASRPGINLPHPLTSSTTD